MVFLTIYCPQKVHFFVIFTTCIIFKIFMRCLEVRKMPTYCIITWYVNSMYR